MDYLGAKHKTDFDKRIKAGADFFQALTVDVSDYNLEHGLDLMCRKVNVDKAHTVQSQTRFVQKENQIMKMMHISYLVGIRRKQSTDPVEQMSDCPSACVCV